jgi:hypothetical protein
MPQEDKTRIPSISREQFRENPKAAVDQAVRDGRILITDSSGRAVAAISRPTDRRPVSFD